MVIELLIIILVLYCAYSISARNRGTFLRTLGLKIDEVMNESGVSCDKLNISKEHSKMVAKYAREFNGDSCIGFAIHICCHYLVDGHGEIFDRLEDRLLSKATELGYYNPDNDEYKGYECGINDGP